MTGRVARPCEAKKACRECLNNDKTHIITLTYMDEHYELQVLIISDLKLTKLRK